MRQRQIEELELKLREFRSVEMIYREHEATFATEMNKYLAQAANPHLSQTIVRQLVSTNVLLKEHADKQMEEKRQYRKKLLQVERQNSDQQRQMEKQEHEIKELKQAYEKLKNENKLKDNEIRNLKASSNFLTNQSTPSVNKENILIVNDTLEFEENSINNCNNSKTNDSDLKYADDPNKLDHSKRSLEVDDDIINIDTPSPAFLKKRKNPFMTNQEDEDDEIRPNQAGSKAKFQKFKSFNELSLSQRFKESPSLDIEIVKPISNLKKSRVIANESNASSGASSKAFNYLSDGLGGRAKVTNSTSTASGSSLNSSTTIKPIKKQNFLTKFKVSNFN